MMAGIRGKNTKPELVVRQGLHARGFRYLLHDKRLPGKPDLVFPKHRTVIFVHGCFWHGHDCHLFKWPKTRKSFWRTKIERNREIDESAMIALAESGWRCCVVWECALKGRTRLVPGEVIRRTAKWLQSRTKALEIRGTKHNDSKRALI
jgi:DNA mismatch endonuclease, patch repair protein